MAALLASAGLTRYYDLAGERIAPVGEPPRARAHAWLDPVIDAVSIDGARGATDICSVEVDVQGIHCSACVWLMNETFRRAGGVAITVNPTLGSARLTWHRGAFDLRAWIEVIERFGYQFGPRRKLASTASGSLTWRLGVVVALTMNVMLFSLSFYFGLSARSDAELYRLFSRLALGLSTAVVIIGGWPFLRTAVRGLQSRVLHLDLPIALGIALVYGTSVASVARGRGGELVYFDTLNVFITLMLLGRFLQQQVLERNRQVLLEDAGAEGIYVRRIGTGDGSPTQLEVAPAPSIRAGDRLLVAPGELIPVDAHLRDVAARISMDWITGESVPRSLGAGMLVPAGSFNAGAAAFTVTAAQNFADSSLVALLRRTSARAARGAASDEPATARAGATRHLQFWDGLARRWVAGVLGVSAIGVGVWLPRDPGRALDVAVALLVVTCPCAIGIALPLGYEIVQARLRRAGFFVRTGDLLDRLERVRKLVFDKTGTLTLRRLELVQREGEGEGEGAGDGASEEAGVAAVGSLDAETRAIAYNLASRSGHPVATCIAAALGRAGAGYDPSAEVHEQPGDGLEWQRPDGLWRLGRPAWTTAGLAPNPVGAAAGAAAGTWLTRDGAVVTRFSTREALRPGAIGELAALRAAGYDIHLISGDSPDRVSGLARSLGIPVDRAHAGRTPADKATDLARIGGDDALFLGDGANDALAFGNALCAGTVAIDRPILPGRSDFFLIGDDLAPLRLALAAAHRLRRVARSVLAISLVYNVLAVSTALSGRMSPVRAAIFMPLSSLSILLFTVFALRPRAPGTAPDLRLLPPAVEVAA